MQFTQLQRPLIFLLRVSLGVLFLYSGLSKISNPQWSAAGYLKGAETFASFYAWLMQPGLLPLVNFINEWGQLLLGVSLLLGIGVRLSSVLGAVLMMLYYFPELKFPYAGKHGFLVDEHVIYAQILLLLAVVRAGRIYGLEEWCFSLPLCSKIPGIRRWFG